MKDIKETLELLAAIELLVVSGVEIVKDGIDASDIAPGIQLLSKANMIVEGVKGVGEIGEEIKDLDQAELLVLGTATFQLVKKVIAATKKPVVA